MGDIAEQLIDEEMFGSSEKYYKSKGNWKRTPAEKKIASIRKEIVVLIKEFNMGVQEARKIINQKYGKGWRERGLVSNSDNQWSPEELKQIYTYEQLKNNWIAAFIKRQPLEKSRSVIIKQNDK